MTQPRALTLLIVTVVSGASPTSVAPDLVDRQGPRWRMGPNSRSPMAARRRQRDRRRERVSAGDVAHLQHGTWAAYTTDKCRCPECRAFKSAYLEAYRARQHSA